MPNLEVGSPARDRIVLLLTVLGGLALIGMSVGIV
jgi:hypothetical protein